MNYSSEAFFPMCCLGTLYTLGFVLQRHMAAVLQRHILEYLIINIFTVLGSPLFTLAHLLCVVYPPLISTTNILLLTLLRCLYLLKNIKGQSVYINRISVYLSWRPE